MLLALLGAALMLMAAVQPAQAQRNGGTTEEQQSLVELYRAQRFQAQVERLEQERRRVTPRTPDRIVSPGADSLLTWLRQVQATPAPVPLLEEAPAFEVTDHYPVRWLMRDAFRKLFAEVDWAYLGLEGITPLDTSRTRALRARLQARFGPPTRTIADVEMQRGRPIGDPIQFEYWFVVNDTIPLIVADVDGPFDRGLVVATDARLRGQLPALRKAFLEPVALSAERAPYVDYFYASEEDAWYRTGYDGNAFFTERIRRPLLIPGRRPNLRRRSP